MSRLPSRRPRLRHVGRRVALRDWRLKGRFLPLTQTEAPLPVRFPAPPAEVQTRLRPPGALDEASFLARCIGCADCVMACPHGAILQEVDGLPFIDPDLAPCLLCSGVPCSKICEAEALLPLEHPHEARLGLPQIDASRCLPHLGQACQRCFDACLLRSVALHLVGVEQVPLVLAGLCTGCGICQHVCPARAITVQS